MRKTSRARFIVAAYLSVLAIAYVLLGNFGVQAATLVTRIVVNVQATLSNPLDLVTAQAPLQLLKTIDWGNGVGANPSNVVWSDQRTLTTGATQDLDFAGGGLTDALGVAAAP